MGKVGILTGILKLKNKAENPDTQNTIAKAVEEVTDTVETFNPNEQATRRQKTDMLSDSRLSKAIRPISIIWMLALFTGCLIANWAGVKTDEQFQELIFWATMSMIVFYFPGRDIVKTITSKRK